MTSDLQKEMRLGNLLIQLQLLSESDLQEAAQLAVELSLPLGKVLVMSGFITDEQLQAIVHAQSMLKDQIVSIDVARSAMKIVSNQRISWEEALTAAGWQQPDVLPANKLGKLLVDAELLSDDDLDAALESARQSNLPLGRILLLTKRLSDAVLCSCLNAQILLRDGKISREQALKGLKSAQHRRMSVEQALEEQGIYRNSPKARIRLGEMLVLAGILTEETMMEAIERGLVTDTPLGQVLLQHNFINMNVLDNALKLQEIVDNGSITPLHSAEVLKHATTKNVSVAQAMTDLGLEKVPNVSSVNLSDLLKLAGVLTEDDVQDAFRKTMQNSNLMGKILTITGYLDDDMLAAALRCQTLIKQGALQQDQAIIALNYCQRMRCPLDDALIELGWALQPAVQKL